MVVTRHKRASHARAARSVDPRKVAVVEILRAADRLRSRFTAVLEPYGLTVQQYNVLRILRGALPDPLPTMEIAARMIERTPGITGLLDRLEAKGLIARVRQDEDRRCVRCSISESGLALLDQLDDPVAHADAEAFATLDEAELTGLLRLLRTLRGE